jgi:tagaturonate reductase
LLTVSEVYRLWAIEGDEHVRSILSFAQADTGVVIEPNVDIYRELKLRMLNGTHTMSSGLAFLAGCETVKSAMDDETVSSFIADIMQKEIAPNIPYEVSPEMAQDFSSKVLDRFRNPHIQHLWINITLNYSSKIRLRCLPVLQKYYEKTETAPTLFSLGFAAYIYFMKAITVRDGKYFGDLNGVSYFIQDELAETFYKRWAGLSVPALVKEVLNDVAFWGTDLSSLPNFTEAVTENLNSLINHGVKETTEATLSKKVLAA